MPLNPVHLSMCYLALKKIKVSRTATDKYSILEVNMKAKQLAEILLRFPEEDLGFCYSPVDPGMEVCFGAAEDAIIEALEQLRKTV